MKGRRLWRASEAVAASILEDLGYSVRGQRVKVTVSGVEVGEVDIVAEKDGVTYAVEVKAGAVDVSGVRQAYVNAKLLGARPLVVARGYADESAKALAEELGVEVIVLPDALPVTPDDVYEAVRLAVLEAVEELVSRLFECPQLTPTEVETLEAIVSTSDLGEAALKLGVTLEELAARLGSLRRSGILAQGSYSRLKVQAGLALLCIKLRGSTPVGMPQSG